MTASWVATITTTVYGEEAGRCGARGWRVPHPRARRVLPTGVRHTINTPFRPGEAPLLANRVAGACEWQEAGYGGHVHSCNACVQNIGRKVRQCGFLIASECRASGLTYCLIVVGQDGYAMLEGVRVRGQQRRFSRSKMFARTFRCEIPHSQRRAGERMADCDDRMKKQLLARPESGLMCDCLFPRGLRSC